MNRQKIRKGIQTYALLLFPLIFVFFSPYIIVVSASEGILSASPIMFFLMLLTSIVCSRLFCGWLCPAGAMQDQIGASNNKSWNGKWINGSKYIIWTLWFSSVMALWATHWPLKVEFFHMTGVNLEMVIIYFIVASCIYLFSMLTGKRGVCHSLCWMAPFMVIGEKTADLLHIPRFRLKADSKACISCGQCNKNCPMSLDVQTLVLSGQMDSTECVACLACADGCPKRAIASGIKRKNE